MKYIIFSDIHLSNWQGGSNSKERISQRLVDQKSILQQLIDLAVKNNAILLHGGDVFHCVGAVPTEALNIYNWFINECKRVGVKYYTATGNHDLAIRKNFSEWHNILNLFQSTEERNKELSLLKPTVKFVDYQDEDVENIKGWDILILHKQPECSNKYGFKHEGINWKKVAKNNRLSFYGHFHETKKLSSTVFVIGQPMQMTQSDIGEERGCWFVDSENWSVEFINLEYPELKKSEKVETKEDAKFEERIKSSSFQDILVEWLDREQKPQTYLDLIQKDITDKIQIVKNVFNGKITGIYLENFLSVDEIKIEYKNGFWLVLGENGSGKTSLTGEGIYWILFDDTTKDMAKSEVVRNRPTKQKEAVGELSLVDNKQFYLVRRSSKDGLEIIQDNKNVVEGMTKTQAQEFLEKQILGFDKNTYLAACYFSQEKLLTLAQLGDTDTTSLVTNLLGFETYDSLYVQMDLKKKEITLQLGLLEQNSTTLKNEIWKNGELQKNLKEQIYTLNQTKSALEEEQTNVTIQIGELTTLLGNIVVPSVTTRELDVSLLALNGIKSELVTKRNQLQEDRQNRTQDLRKQISALQKDLTKNSQEQNNIDKEKIRIESEIRTIEQSIANHRAIIDSLKENKCVYCGTVLKKDELEKHYADEQSAISALIESLPVFPPDFEKQLESLYDQEAKINELIEHINKQILDSDAEIKQLLDANFAEITKIETDIKVMQKERDDVLALTTEANGRKDSLTAQIKQLEQRKTSLVNQLQQINVEAKLTQSKELENNADNLNSEMYDIEDKIHILNENLVIYEFWSVAFSNKGIRPLLLDKFVNEFNKVVKHYCYEVSNGEFVVEFTPTSKTQAGISRNKLGLQVIYKDKTVNYSSLSGGEKTRVNLPLCFGLNKWVSNKYGVTNGILGVMILDELFAHLDAKGRDSVAELLNEEGRNKSIFVIDHSDVLTAYTDNLWLVSKQNDITQLQVV